MKNTTTNCIITKTTDLKKTAVVAQDGREWTFDSLSTDELLKFLGKNGLRRDKTQKGLPL